MTRIIDSIAELGITAEGYVILPGNQTDPKIIVPSELERILRGEDLSEIDDELLYRKTRPKHHPITNSGLDRYQMKLWQSHNGRYNMVAEEYYKFLRHVAAIPPLVKLIKRVGINITDIRAIRARILVSHRARNITNRINCIEERLYSTKDEKGYSEIIQELKEYARDLAFNIVQKTRETYPSDTIPETTTPSEMSVNLWLKYIPREILVMYSRLSYCVSIHSIYVQTRINSEKDLDSLRIELRYLNDFLNLRYRDIRSMFSEENKERK